MTDRAIVIVGLTVLFVSFVVMGVMVVLYPDAEGARQQFVDMCERIVILSAGFVFGHLTRAATRRTAPVQLPVDNRSENGSL